MRTDSRGYDQQYSLHIGCRNHYEHREQDSRPQERYDGDLYGERYAPTFSVIADVASKEPIAKQPRIESVGAARIASCGKQEERRRGQYGNEYADDTETDRDRSRYDEDATHHAACARNRFLMIHMVSNMFHLYNCDVLAHVIATRYLWPVHTQHNP